MNIRSLAEQYQDYIVEQRRFFHRSPELSFGEEHTTAAIAAELKRMGLEVTFFQDLCGCVGHLHGSRPGPTVLLRADIDALPVTEQTGLPFASEHPGVMHACGHDCHIAMQLGAARILSELREELSGSVRFFFQSGEETACGAEKAVAQGVLEDVSACFGMHIWARLDAPFCNFQAGERMASCDTFTITIEGMSAHGSEPHLGSDAILAAAAVIQNLQAVASRMGDPVNPPVLTVGTIRGGQRFNIIADHVEMEGALRTFSPSFRDAAEDHVRRIVVSTAEAFGCRGLLEWNRLTGPVINRDREVLDTALGAAASLYGEEILRPMERVTGSEDFSQLAEQVPAVYGFIGAHSQCVPGSGRSNHHPCFTPDESVLHRGAALAAQFARDWLDRQSRG